MFLITEHLDKLEDVKHHYTWIQAKCPVCGGKLKINKSSYRKNSYACYTNDCHKRLDENNHNLIRKAISPNTRFSANSRFGTYRRFKKINKMREFPRNITDKLNLFSDVEYIRPKIIHSSDNRRLIHFDYGDFIWVRVDHSTEEGNSKYFYPLYLKGNQHIKSIPRNACKLYRGSYISRDIVIVEGEKCASVLQKLGINCINFHTSILSDSILPEYTNNLYSKGVRNVIYLPDNDAAGRHKEDLVLQSLWASGINAEGFDIVKDYKEEYVDYQGFDIADLYVEERFDREGFLDIIGA